MKITCSSCGTKNPKTSNGKWINVDLENWAGDFYLFCSELCKEKKLGLAPNQPTKANKGVNND